MAVATDALIDSAKEVLSGCVAALIVLGVFLVGGLVMSQLIRFSGIPVKNPPTELTTHTTGSELIIAACELLVLLVFQYAGYFLLMAPIGWWYRRRGPSAYVLTKASRTWTGLILLGRGTVALSEWLVLGIGFVNSLHPSRTERWEVSRRATRIVELKPHISLQKPSTPFGRLAN